MVTRFLHFLGKVFHPMYSFAVLEIKEESQRIKILGEPKSKTNIVIVDSYPLSKDEDSNDTRQIHEHKEPLQEETLRPEEIMFLSTQNKTYEVALQAVLDRHYDKEVEEKIIRTLQSKYYERRNAVLSNVQK